MRSLLAVPPVPDPPRRVWRDWALVGVIVPVAVLEGLVRDDLVWPWFSVLAAVPLACLLLWRRTHPLAMLVAAFASVTVVSLVALLAGADWDGLDTNVFLLLFPYSVFRWGSGRHAAIGLAVISVPILLSSFEQQIYAGAAGVPTGDLIGGVLVVLVAAAVGASARYQDTARLRTMDQVKVLEREQLARELHDIVAHHVSAIAVRAQAGRVVASADPAAAVDALIVIEEEASRTLAEMRSMVGALRQGKEADLAPQRGAADIEHLTNDAGDRPRVAVELSGDLHGLRPSVDAALYRMAQESITNAVRHGRHASRVLVSVHGETDCVRLIVVDDGDPGTFDPRSSSGYGLIGMAERAKLLGGTLEAGPNRNRGWTVLAVLPRESGRS